MKQIETIKSGKNYSAVSVGKMSEIIEHVLRFALSLHPVNNILNE